MRERAKMTALVEELELPLNVHRWRKLESSDPERYDLIRKAQSLQRNLVSKTESAVKKDLLIQEKVSKTCQRWRGVGKGDRNAVVVVEVQWGVPWSARRLSEVRLP